MSFCNKTIDMSSPLSIIFTPSSLSSSSCCNITLTKPLLSTSTEQIMSNINISQIIPSFIIFNKQMQSIDLMNYTLMNRTYMKSDIMDLPLTFSLCQFNISSFEILITNISKSIGSCLSNQYRCLISNQDQWCIDEIFHCDGYHSCPQGVDEYGCPSMNKT